MTAALVAGAFTGAAVHRVVGDSGRVSADALAPAASDVGDPSVDAPAPGPSGQRERLDAHDCPGGDRVGSLRHLDRILITAVWDADEAWVRTRDPMAPDQVWWVRAEFVAPDADLSGLPRIPCSEELFGLDEWAAEVEEQWQALAEEGLDEHDGEEMDAEDPANTTTTTSTTSTTTTTEPAATTSAPTTAPATTPPATTAPGAATPTTPTTAPPTTSTSSTTTTTSTTSTTTTSTTTTTTTTVPAVVTWSGVSRQHPVIRENFNGGCDTSLPTTSRISATASHPSGIASVQFRTRVGGGAWSGWQTVATGSGAASGQIGPFQAGTAPPNSTVSVSWELRATPNQGEASTISSTANNAVTLTWCSLG